MPLTRSGRALATLLAVAASTAFAESGQLNLHLEPGIGFQSVAPQNPLFGAGLAASLKADYAVADWIAIELVTAGIQFSTDAFAEPGRSAGFGAGVRLRLLDDAEGYLWHLGDAPGHEGNL